MPTLRSFWPVSPRHPESADNFGSESEQRRTAQILWAIFLFFYVPMFYWYGRAQKAWISPDFPSYYYGARLALLEGKTPYGVHAFDPYSAELHRFLYPYFYPPPSLIAFWPLTGLSLVKSFLVFMLASHACLIGSIWLILAKLTPLPTEQRLRELALTLSLVYILCSDAVAGTFANGQINLMVLFFVCLALAALKEGAPAWRIGLPLSLAILLKTYPVLLIFLLLFGRRSKAAALTCIFYGAYTSVAAMVLPSAVWTSWLRDVLPAAVSTRDLVPTFFMWNQSITGFTARLLGENNLLHAPLPHPNLANPVSNLLCLVVLGLTLFIGFRASRNGKENKFQEDKVAAFLLMIYLIAPLSWQHHLVFVLPATVLSIILLLTGSASRKVAIGLILALFLIGWHLPLDHPYLRNGWLTLLISGKFYAVAGLWAFFIYRLYRSGSELSDPKVLTVTE